MTNRTVLGVLVWSLVGPVAASASLINVQFGQSNGGFGGPTSAYSGPAVIGSGGDQWNLFTEPFSINGPFGYAGANLPLVDSAGSATGVRLGFSTPDSFIHVSPAIFSGTPYDGLLTSFLFADNNRNSSRDGPGTVTLAGLTPDAEYRVVLYSAADAPGRGTLFTVNGTSETVTPTATATLAEGVNYADLDAVADGTGTVTITVARAAANSNEGDLNGIQITPVPEPGTCAALLLAGGSLPLRRRGRR